MTGEVGFRQVPVDIVKRKNVFNCLSRQYTCYAAEHGTLAELRIVLEEDQVMATDDRFHIKGKDVGKSAERHIKWEAALEVRVACLERSSALDMSGCAPQAGSVTIISSRVVDDGIETLSEIENGGQEGALSRSRVIGNTELELLVSTKYVPYAPSLIPCQRS